MIRRLMASSAILALMTAGAWSAEPTKQPTDANQPAAVQQDTTGAATTPPPAEQNATTTSDQGAATTDTAANTDKLEPPKPTLATAFVGRSVFSSEDPNADNIGDINDLIIDENGEITQAVVGVGGFLGIGEKNVAVPFQELKVVERDGDIRLIYSASKEQLEAAEAFDRTAYDPRARAAEQQAATDTTATGTGLTPAPAPAPDQTATDTAAPADNMAADTTAAPATTDQNMTADTTAAPATTDQNMAASGTAAPAGDTSFVSFNADQVRASKLIGQVVYGPDNKSIGEIADLVMQEDGKTRAALIDVGGFLGVGEKRVAIPFQDIKVNADPDSPDRPLLNVAMTKEQLEQAPEWQDRTAANAPASDQNMTTGSTTADNNMAADQPAADQPAADFTPMTQEISADNLIGSKVYGADDKDLGEVHDVVFDKGGEIKAVVIDVGGFLGVGEKPVAVQFDALNVQKDTNGDMRLMVNANEDQLKNAPAYDEVAHK